MVNDSKSKVNIVIPVFNEEEAIGEVIDGIKNEMDSSGYEYEIIVVDDGSADRTAEIVLAKKTKLIQHHKNKGVGAARKTGIKCADGNIIVMIDGDGTYPVKDIPRLLHSIPEYDMVVGARTAEAGTVRWLRTPAKWLILRLACFIVGEHIPDLNSGLRAFKKNIALKFMDILPDTHSWVGTITLAFLSNDYKVAFVPIDYYERKGKSTFHPIKDTYNYVMNLIRTVMYFNPLKFFLPLSIVLIVMGFIKFVYDWLILRDVKESDVMIILTALIIGVLGVLADMTVKTQKHRYLQSYGDEETE